MLQPASHPRIVSFCLLRHCDCVLTWPNYVGQGFVNRLSASFLKFSNNFTTQWFNDFFLQIIQKRFLFEICILAILSIINISCQISQRWAYKFSICIHVSFLSRTPKKSWGLNKRIGQGHPWPISGGVGRTFFAATLNLNRSWARLLFALRRREGSAFFDRY